MSLSIARVLSVSLAGWAGCGPATDGRGATGFGAAGLGLGAPSAGSEMPIFAPQRLQRTIRRLPRTFSSAICSCVLQLSQLNCIPTGLYSEVRSGESGKARYVARLRLRVTSVPAFCAR